MSSAPEIRSKMTAELPEITEDLKAFVNQESSSHDLADLEKTAEMLEEMCQRLLGSAPERHVIDGKISLLWKKGTPKVALLCHYDTVWPTGTIDRWPFSVAEGRATGPGIFDMKGGIVESMYALRAMGVPDGVAFCLTPDEEIGSQTSRALIEKLGAEAGAVLVLEPGHHGAIKVGRKGVSWYEVTINGRAAHAGLEPEKGANSLIELAHQVLAIEKIADMEIGTSVTPTVAHAGTTENVVPAKAQITIDVRAKSVAEQERVDREIRALIAINPEIKLEIDGNMNRQPFEQKMASELFDIAKVVANELGLTDLEGIEVGGGSDGNFTAVAGIRTLDGLGIVGDGAHAEGEWADLNSIPERGALVAGIIESLIS